MMNKLTVALFGIALAAAQMPAVAGPNWDVIHTAEARHLAHHTEEHVLPLDHGPRAITTPWLNKVHEDELHLATQTGHGAHDHVVAANTAMPAVTAHN